MAKVVHMTTVDMSVRHLLLNQLLALRAAGFEVGAVSADGPDLGPVRAAGVAHFPVSFTRRMTPLQDLKAAWQIWRLCRRERFTIVHTHQVKAALFGQVAARLAGVPIVVNTVHGFYFHEHTPPLKRQAWILLERFCALFSDVLLSQNREDIGTAVESGICQAGKIQHLGNGIDVRKFDRASVPEDRLERLRSELGIPAGIPVVGFVGRLVAEKGLVEFFEAIAQLRKTHPDMRVLLVGPVDHDMPDCLGPEAAARAGIADITVFAGYRGDMPDLYALMSVLVLPSHREGLPRAPMEASAMGVPSVATAIRGCREVVRPGENGYLVPVRDVAAIAGAIDRILGDPAHAATLGLRARAIAVAEFDEQIVFGRVAATYRRLIAAKGLD
ncbi:MAG: glycosyltransferase family 4 protein [Acidobacteriota bacterium]|nr:glycosyltransferase family 4 protein [Acidobacteriota bacterium]